MEILFLYLENYKNFKRQSLSFTPQFVFTTNIARTDLHIHIKDNPQYFPNFFENPDLLNVTAIIGQNGTGKSNVLDFIKDSLPFGTGGFSEQCIIGLRVESAGTGEEELLLYVTPKLQHVVKLNDMTGKFQRVDIEAEKETGILKINYQIDSLHNTTFIFYSNVVDMKLPSTLTRSKLAFEEEPGSTTGIANISTMALLAKDQEDYTNDPTQFIDKVDAYKAREIARNVEFIISPHKHLIPFPPPEHLFISIMNDDERALKKDSNTDGIFQELEKFREEFEYRNIKDAEVYLRHFKRAIFFNQMRTDLKFSNIHFSDTYLKDVRGDNFDEYFENFLRALAEVIYNNSDVHSLRVKSEAMRELLRFITDYLDKHPQELSTVDEPILRIAVTFEGSFNIRDFMLRYIATKSITDFINFKFRSLSSGEQSLLSLLSRFFTLTTRLEGGIQKKNLIILFDEPDIYFHPEWQRKILSLLIDYIPKLFPNCRLQFIITANTPYLASDLPAHNVIMFRCKDDHAEAIPTDAFTPKTFGANIHTLLSDSFYVTNFMGEFAKRKIETLVRYLQDENQIHLFSQEEAQKLINYIGEPIIRERLQDMYNDRFEIQNIELQEQRDRLAAQLEEIDRQLQEKRQ